MAPFFENIWKNKVKQFYKLFYVAYTKQVQILQYIYKLLLIFQRFACQHFPDPQGWHYFTFYGLNSIHIHYSKLIRSGNGIVKISQL